MKTIAMMNRKGGTGKTTSTYNLAAYLRAAGKRVLLIDLDSQRNLTYIAGALDADITADNVLGISETITALEAIDSAGQDIISASPALSIADRVLQGVGTEYRLKESLEPIQGIYDYCIVDTPPQLGSIVANALTAADEVIITATPDALSVQGIAQLKTMIESVQKYSNKALSINGILVTRYQRSNLSKAIREDIEQIATLMHTKVYQSYIRECTAIREAQTSHEDIFTYAPRSNGAKDYASFGKEFLQDEKKRQ